MRTVLSASTLLLCPLLVSSSRNYYEFGGKKYPLHFSSPPTGLNNLYITGGDIEQSEGNNHSATTETVATDIPPSAPPLKEPSFLRKGWQRGQAAFGAAFKKPKLKLPKPKTMEQLKESSSKLLSAVGPATVAIGEYFYSSSPQARPIPLASIFALALLGSSSGFYLFLYFITVGYASGILLPLLVAMVAYNTKSKMIPLLTNIHSSLVIVWGIRSVVFFLWREFVIWPELHEKVVEVNKAARLNAKCFCWLVFSIFYVCMITPCLLRFETKRAWGPLGMSAIVLQLCGLVLESVADCQKSRFKTENKNDWCNVGLWSWSTHPNYFGEALFWIATYLGGMACFDWSVINWSASTVGLGFILIVLRGAVSSLGAKHLRKYGNDVEFLEFRQTHGVLGRKLQLKPHQPNDRLSL